LLGRRVEGEGEKGQKEHEIQILGDFDLLDKIPDMLDSSVGCLHMKTRFSPFVGFAFGLALVGKGYCV
jgi:hypothetical protein